jgi:hypothetical protein
MGTNVHREKANMKEMKQLVRLEEWLKATGRKKTWFARTIGYSYQMLWSKIAGVSYLTDDFVVACFERCPDMPYDIFIEHGYIRDDNFVYRRIPLGPES